MKRVENIMKLVENLLIATSLILGVVSQIMNGLHALNTGFDT